MIKRYHEKKQHWKKLKSVLEQDDVSQLDNVEDFIEDSGHKMLAICMNHEQHFKEALANELCHFLNKKINQMEKL